MDDAGKGKFFLFNTEDATFAPFAQIAISDTTSLIVVDAPKSAKLPSSYSGSGHDSSGRKLPGMV